ncbi:hypothetical protein H4582DRAFT_1979507 [Lactarius indigo]|nr:hypothetical protein H4582DRAFT_1979507 [Lactarius indigo]
MWSTPTAGHRPERQWRVGIVGLRICFQTMAWVGYSASADVISHNVFCIITALSSRTPDSFHILCFMTTDADKVLAISTV